MANLELLERSSQLIESDDRILEQRISLLKRLRSMLEIQRDKFRGYLNVLEQQETSIQKGDVTALEVQTQLEQQVVREILSVQKVIKPLDSMYKKAYPQQKQEIAQLQQSLDTLKTQVLQRNEQNRLLLSRQRDELKKKIESLRIPKARKSVYARSGTPSIIDISC